MKHVSVIRNKIVTLVGSIAIMGCTAQLNGMKKGPENAAPVTAAQERVVQLKKSIEDSHLVRFQREFKAGQFAEDTAENKRVGADVLKHAKAVLEKRSAQKRHWFDTFRIAGGLGLIAYFYIRKHWACTQQELELAKSAYQAANMQSGTYINDLGLKGKLADAKNMLEWKQRYSWLDSGIRGLGLFMGAYLLFEGYAGSNQQRLFKNAYSIVRELEKSESK